MAQNKPLLDNARMKLVRRVHMYAGLFLSPIILVYAFSSFIFNHYTWFAEEGSDESELSASAFSDTLLTDMPDGKLFSEKLIQKLNTEYPDNPFSLTDETPPRYDRPFFVMGVGSEGSVIYRLNVDEQNFTQILRPKVGDGDAENLILTEFSEPVFDEAAKEKVIASLELASRAQGLDFKSFNIRVVPDLIFSAKQDDLFWDLRYNLQTGQLSAASRKSGKNIRLSNLLLRYHTTHTYPNEFGVRTIWAIFVDLLAALMLFWVLSGLMMWWQMKAVRRVGIIVFGSSIFISGILFILLRGNFLQ